MLVGLDAEMAVAASEEDAAGLKKQIKAREDALLPMYLQVRPKKGETHHTPDGDDAVDDIVKKCTVYGIKCFV